jgi:hypothetical protein
MAPFFSSSTTHIYSCLGKEVGLWLIVRWYIHSFHITHFTFTSTLCFCLSLIQPSASSFFTCECGHGLNTSNTHLTSCLFRGQRIATHDAIKKSCMPLFEKVGTLYGKSGDTPYVRSFITNWFYMTRENQVFIVDVVVTNPTWKMMATSVINWPKGAVTKFNAITNIHKYNGLHEGHHFILMAMEVHNTPRRDMDHFIKECVHLFHDRWLRGHLSLSFYIQFFRQHVNIILQHDLTSIIETKITLVGDVCSKPPIIIRLHDLHVGNIRGVVGEIVSYHERD